MPDEGTAAEKLRAAELLLSDAVRDRDEAQGRVDWLTGLVAQYQGAQAKKQPSLPLLGSEDTGTDSREVGYGAIKSAVYNATSEAHRKLKMAEITDRFIRLGVKTGAKNPRESVKNAVKALLREGKLRKVGPLHYRAVEVKVPE